MSLTELTKDFIAKTYKSLVKQFPEEQVSVTAIVKTCNVNRKTFYYHFSDIFDLNIWIFRSEFAKEIQANLPTCDFVVDTEMPNEKYRDLAFYINSRGKTSPQDMGSFWSILSAYMHKNQVFYRNVLIADETNNNNLAKYILKIYCIQIEKDIQSNLSPRTLPREDTAFLASYFTNACVGWILNNVNAFLPDYFPPDQLVCDFIFSNITHTLIKLLTRENTLQKLRASTHYSELKAITSLVQTR